ncbi:MAG TPA: thioesterase family protein [Myxococcales bacterium]|nr:thioesterase family protein [Myxococcales bacterium]
MNAFFIRDGARLVATELTRGPWSNEHQHGGPPAALLTGAIERAGADAADFRLARVTVEFLRPVPIAPLEVSTEVVRAGKQAQRIAASLDAAGMEVARAIGLRLRRQPLDLKELAGAPTLPHPDTLSPFRFSFFRHEVAYHTAIEMRIARGVWAEGPIDAWMRPLCPLVAGEKTSPCEGVLILADAESGVCPPVDPVRWSFLNPDLTVYFGREPRGQWIGLSIVSEAHADGTGLAQSALSDLDGPFGRAAQSLVVAPRAPTP